jgi:hypothetical protein
MLAVAGPTYAGMIPAKNPEWGDPPLPAQQIRRR